VLRKRKIEKKRFCKECGEKLSILNKGNTCFRHHTKEAERSVGFPVLGASSGPLGGSVRYTQRQEYGRYID